MMGTIQSYVIEQLACTGFALLNSKIAYEMRRDIWATPLNAGQHFSESIPRLEELFGQLGVRRFLIRFEDTLEERVRVIARSDDRLAERIRWLTGRAVLAIEEVDALYDAKAEPAPAVPATVEGEVIPSYPCLRRTQMLRKAGITRDPLYDREPDKPFDRPRF